MFNRGVFTKKRSYHADEVRFRDIEPMKMHLPIFILRKSIGKLSEYSNLFKSKRIPANDVIEFKYKLAQCRPEIISMLTSIAVRIEDMDFSESYSNDRMRFKDKQTGARFNIYYKYFDNDTHKFISIDGQKILTLPEAHIMLSLAKSIYQTQQNRREIDKQLYLEKVQDNLFDMYKKNQG